MQQTEEEEEEEQGEKGKVNLAPMVISKSQHLYLHELL